MIAVIINAYACAPNKGSEPGMAWNWIIHLAKHCHLHVITEGEWQVEIEQALRELPQGRNITFYYNPVSASIREMCWNQGDWRFYAHYKAWQWRTYQMALEITRTTKIDVLHQLNMIGFREPGYLWQIEGIPFVWGPVDAKEKFPVAFLSGAPLKTQLFMRLKNTITQLQLRYSRRVRMAARRASVVVAASSESRHSFKKYFGIEAQLINETGCHSLRLPHVNKPPKETFDLLWVGKFDFRKQLAIAIQTIARLSNHNIRLHIVGNGHASGYQMLAKKLGVAEKCIWHGVMPHSQVQEMMRACDLLFFTSVAEGTPHVVLEAIANHLPIVCFDVCGQGDSVTNEIGVKIPLLDPSSSIEGFAKTIESMVLDREMLKQMSVSCEKRQVELSWDNKASEMVRLYQKVIAI